MVRMYSVALRKYVEIPTANISKVTKSGHNFMVGRTKVNGKDVECWQITK